MISREVVRVWVMLVSYLSIPSSLPSLSAKATPTNQISQHKFRVSIPFCEGAASPDGPGS